MASYTSDHFINKIDKTQIQCVLELGSYNLLDAKKLYQTFKCPIYAFECNPDCIENCKKIYETCTHEEKDHIHLIDNAVSLVDKKVDFYPFDPKKYDNIGASSMLKIDFGKRDPSDVDFNRPNPQKHIQVDGIRLDTFLVSNGIEKVDLLCMDLQGYELVALQSLGRHIQNIKYIITECSLQSTYTNGVNFNDLDKFLKQFGFKYVCSNKWNNDYPPNYMNIYCEFDALFEKIDYK